MVEVATGSADTPINGTEQTSQAAAVTASPTDVLHQPPTADQASGGKGGATESTLVIVKGKEVGAQRAAPTEMTPSGGGRRFERSNTTEEPEEAEIVR